MRTQKDSKTRFEKETNIKKCERVSWIQLAFVATARKTIAERNIVLALEEA